MHRTLPMILAALLLLLPACQADYRSLRRATLDLPDQQTSAELPAEFKDGWIIVEATINDLGPYRFVFDTGAPFGVLSTAAAAEIGLRNTSNTEVTDITGSKKNYPVAFSKSVRIGPARVTRLPFIVTDDTAGFFTELDTVGILGYDALDLFTVDIDYPAGRLSIRTGRLDPDAPGVLPMRTEGHTPAVPVDLHLHNGAPSQSAWFTVDTGGQMLLHLDESLATWAHADVAALLEETVGLTETKAYYKTAPLAGVLRLGDHDMIHASGEIDTASSLIGYHFLKPFRIQLDSRSDLASFTRPSGQAGSITAPRHHGVGIMQALTFDAEPIIVRLRAGSPAANAGILPNDRILAIDGEPVDAPGAYAKLGWTFDPPAPVTLTLSRDGEVFDRTLTPELLFPDDLDRLRGAGPDLEPAAVEAIKNPDGTWELIFPEGFNSGDDAAPDSTPSEP